METIPNEVLTKIFEFLPMKDWAKTILVSERFRGVGTSTWYWRQVFFKNRESYFTETSLAYVFSVRGCWMLREIYRTLNDDEAIVDILKKMAYDRCLAEGTRILGGKEEWKSSVDMACELMMLWKKWAKILMNFSLSMIAVDDRISAEIGKVFNNILNKSKRLPEYLSLYLDKKLRRGKVELTLIEYEEQLLDPVVGAFRYLMDKDAFLKYYQIHLGKRILGAKCANEDAENYFVQRMKSEYGSSMMSKIAGMLEDMTSNKILKEEFKKHCAVKKFTEETGMLEMDVFTLKSGYWPVTYDKADDLVQLPPVLSKAKKFFSDFHYKEEIREIINSETGKSTTVTAKRRLRWKFQMGNVTIRPNGFHKPYELITTTHQALILLCFNDDGIQKLTIVEMQERTKLQMKELQSALQYLNTKFTVHRKILLKGRKRNEDEHSPENAFKPNNDFRSQILKICAFGKVRTVVKPTPRPFWRMDPSLVILLDAFIVREMKRYWRITQRCGKVNLEGMKHEELVEMVIEKLKDRYVVKPDQCTDQCKKRIENLIEREYLKRSKNDRLRYQYIP